MEALSKLDVDALFEEFGEQYLRTPEGKRNLATYPVSRQTAHTNWESILVAKQNGKEVSNEILDKLLPHLNSPHNRDRDVWIHIAHAITKDLKKWFELIGFSNSKHNTKVEIWKKFGYCPPYTKLEERKKILSTNKI